LGVGDRRRRQAAPVEGINPPLEVLEMVRRPGWRSAAMLAPNRAVVALMLRNLWRRRA
jgi:uncharacterized membrane protein (DUF2068 family)